MREQLAPLPHGAPFEAIRLAIGNP